MTREQTDRRGKPLASRSELDGLSKIRCWNCNRIIATGVLPPIAPGEILVIQCGHRECKAFNKFEEDLHGATARRA